jgi:hypothetical protein
MGNFSFTEVPSLGLDGVEFSPFRPGVAEDSTGRYHLQIEMSEAMPMDPPNAARHIVSRDAQAGDWWNIETQEELQFWVPRFGLHFQLNLSSRRGKAGLSKVAGRRLAQWRNILRLLYFYSFLEAGGMLLHASGIVRRGRAYLFPGVSGAGKTTIVRHSPGLRVLSDEVVAVRIGHQDQSIMAFGTPFFGDWGQPGEMIAAPVRGLYFPRQASENRLRSLSPREVLSRLLPCVFTYTNWQPRLQKIFDLVAQLAGSVPGYDLHFQPSPDFWQSLDGH